MPGEPTPADVEDARTVLRRYFPPTRLVPAESLSRLAGTDVFLKLESELPTGSFKVRGAMYGLSTRLREQAITDVVTASTGNHGAAVAYAARLLGVRATIFVPQHPNPVKRARIAALGAQIVEIGSDLTAAREAAAEHALRPATYLLDDATDRVLPAGPGTMGWEILEQLPAARSVIVPIGDTALIRGVAAAIRTRQPNVMVIGVQAERAPSYYMSWKRRTVVQTDTCDTIADGLATRTPDERNVGLLTELVSDIHLVTEDQMLDAIAHLLVEEHVVTEPAGAAATAALLSAERAFAGPIVLIVSGANVTLDILQRALARHNVGREDVGPR